MATLTSNDEQVVCGGDATAEELAEEGKKRFELRSMAKSL